MPANRRRLPSPTPNATPAPVRSAVPAAIPHLLKVEEAPFMTSRGTSAAATPAERAQADLACLNLSFLHVARELSRSARELAITRLGLDAECCAALDRLSLADLHALAHSQALIFSLRVDARALSAQAELSRHDRIASEARLVLSARTA